VALAWVQARPGLTSTVIGARRMDQFEANLTALDLTLDPGLRERRSSAAAPRRNFPAANNASLSRIAQNGGPTVAGVPTSPGRIVAGTHVY
jgi:hypothetical protein